MPVMLKVLDRVAGLELLVDGRLECVEYTEDAVAGVKLILETNGCACEIRCL